MPECSRPRKFMLVSSKNQHWVRKHSDWASVEDVVRYLNDCYDPSDFDKNEKISIVEYVEVRRIEDGFNATSLDNNCDHADDDDEEEG